MSYCETVCNVPAGLGSCYGGRLWPSYGLGSLCGTGLGTLSGGWSGLGTLSGGWAGLGTQSGANVACTDQLAGSEVVVQPPPSVVTMPGPILSATSAPVAVAQTSFSGLGSQGLAPQYSSGALGGYGRSGLYGGSLYGSGLYGGGLYGGGLYGGGLYGGLRRYGQRCLPYSGWGYGACVPCAPCGPC